MCWRPIGESETPMVWRDLSVCPECWRALQLQTPAPAKSTEIGTAAVGLAAATVATAVGNAAESLGRRVQQAGGGLPRTAGDWAVIGFCFTFGAGFAALIWSVISYWLFYAMVNAHTEYLLRGIKQLGK